MVDPFFAFRLVLAWVGAIAALAYFPHLALSNAPRGRKRWALALTLLGIAWVVAAYALALQMEPAVLFTRTESFANLAPFGVLALMLERYFGNPLFQIENDVGHRWQRRLAGLPPLPEPVKPPAPENQPKEL